MKRETFCTILFYIALFAIGVIVRKLFEVANYPLAITLTIIALVIAIVVPILTTK
ncbi:MAG: hypothetical protein HFJ41_00415 [Clostridia bacterium]|nr:hypothetical protein [Clostridia bacterium]